MGDGTAEQRQAAERKKLLKRWGLTEQELKSLRSLDDAETKWRIEHEYKNGCEFIRERADFMLAECLTGKTYQPPIVGGGSVMVLPHSEAGGRATVGSRVG